MNINLTLTPLDEINEVELSALESLWTSTDKFYSAIPYLEYVAEYSSTKFFIISAYHEGKLLAAVTYNLSGSLELSCGGKPISLYFSINESSKVKKKLATLLFERLLKVAKEEKKFSIVLDDCPYFKELCFGLSYEIGTTLNGQTDLLKLPEDSLSWLRKSYRSLVNWGKKNLEILQIDRNNLDPEKFNTVRDFHIKVAGRETRSARSWELQLQAIKNSNDFLNMAYFEGKLVSANLIMTSKKQAFYGVGINDRSLMEQNIPIGHYPIWHAMIHSKKIGMNLFDFGNIGPSYLNEKEKNIATFKKGFCQDLVFKNYIILKTNA